VLSIAFVLVGGLACSSSGRAVPEHRSPTVVVTRAYPGANPQVLADTVAAPIEQEVNGVENMLYMSAQCAADGSMTLTVTSSSGRTSIKPSQVQNRVSVAEPKLPEEVRVWRHDGQALSRYYDGREPYFTRRPIRQAVHR